MNQKLPSDALTKPTRRMPWILGGIGAAAIAVTAVIAGPSIAASLNPQAAPTPTATPYVATLTPAELDSVQQGADQQAAIIAAEKAAAEKAAADAAAAQAAADAAAQAATHSSGSSVHGRKVPFIKSDDPQNANGGDWDMSVCEGGSASTGADGTPYCD